MCVFKLYTQAQSHHLQADSIPAHTRVVCWYYSDVINAFQGRYQPDTQGPYVTILITTQVQSPPLQVDPVPVLTKLCVFTLVCWLPSLAATNQTHRGYFYYVILQFRITRELVQNYTVLIHLIVSFSNPHWSIKRSTAAETDVCVGIWHLIIKQLSWLMLTIDSFVRLHLLLSQQF